MSDLQRRAGAFRRRRNDIENHIVDEYVAGRIDRLAKAGSANGRESNFRCRAAGNPGGIR